jgi:CIC family chloride channel protein
LELIGETIAEDISLPLSLLVMLLVMKLLATSFTLGSGNSGGVFAPGLFMGAVLGGIVGTVGQRFFPGVVAHPGAYAIVGMAAVFSGAARAPMTAVLIVFEMSNDYRLILPLMLATVISTLLAEGLYRDSIYTEKLRLKGISLQQGRDLDILQGVMVHEVMTREVDTVPVDLSLAELSRVFNRTRHHGMAVVDKEGYLWGLVTISDLDRALGGAMPPESTISKIGTPLGKVVVVYPDEDIGEVLARMGIWDFGRLPVVERGETRRLVGMIRRQDIIRAYNLALARRAEVQHRTKHLQLRNLDGTDVVYLTLSMGDRAVGLALEALAETLPHECVLISVRRQGRVIIPHGDTVFQVGDQVTAFMGQADQEAYYLCMCGNRDE